MNCRTFKLWGMVAALGLLASWARAQGVDGVAGVPVKFWGSASDSAGDGSGGSGSLSIATSNGNVASSGAGGDSFSMTANTALLVPGQVYQVNVDQIWTTVDSSLGVTTQAYFVAPPGYLVYINDQPPSGNPAYVSTNYASFDTSNSGTYTGTISVCIVGPGQLNAKAGTCSSITSGQIYWQVALGSLKNGTSAGSLVLADSGLSSSWGAVFTPADLQYQSPSQEMVTYNSGSTLRQILGDEADVDIVTTSASTYELRFYNPAQRYGTAFPYGFSGLPFVVYQIGQVGTSNELQITSVRYDAGHLDDAGMDLNNSGSSAYIVRTAVTTLTQTGSSMTSYRWVLDDWHDSGGAVQREEIRQWSGTTENRTEQRTVSIPGGTGAVTTVNNSFALYTWGEELNQSTVGSSSTAITTNFQYYTDPTQLGTYAFPSQSSVPGGTWSASDYNDNVALLQIGTLYHVYRPFVSSPATVPGNPIGTTAGSVTTYQYSADAFGMPTRPSSIVTAVDAQTVAQSAITYADLTTTPNGATVVVASRSDTVDATSGSLASTTAYYREDTPDDFFLGQVYSVTKPNGVQQSYVYQRGTFTVGSTYATWSFSPTGTSAETAAQIAAAASTAHDNSSGAASNIASCVAVITGSNQSSAGTEITTYNGSAIQPIYLVTGESTLQVTIRDTNALVRRTESYAWVGGAWNLIGWVDYTYDAAGFLQSRVTPTATHSWTYTGEQLTAETDETGIAMSYSYDTGGRPYTAAKSGGPTKYYSYDAEGRILSTQLKGSSGDTLTTSFTYDDSGRLSSTTPAGLSQLTYTYDSGGLSRTTTYAGDNTGATRIETSTLDGRPASVTGTAAYAQYYSYSIDSGSADLITQINYGSTTSVRQTQQWTDWLGRTAKVQLPAPPGQSNLIELYTYDPSTPSSGQLTEVTRTGYAPMRYQYDAMGNVSSSGLDLGHGLTPASTDRITNTSHYVESYNGALWLHQESDVYPIAGSATAYTVSVTRTRLTGFTSGQLAETQSTDASNNVTDQVVTVNTGTKTVTRTTTLPSAAYANPLIELIVNGLNTSVTNVDGLITTFGFDDLERPSTIKDARNNVTTNVYYTNSPLVNTVSDPVATVATYVYDGMGRKTSVTDADGFSIGYSYNNMGQVLTQSGTGSYPVSYTYDSTYGDRTYMSTYRSGTSGTADQTHWTYDAASGLLTSKTDPSNASVGYTYNLRGQISVRTWARGTTTTYGYDSQTGELTSLAYNDSTPAVGYSYTRTGQLSTASDFTGTRTFNYDPTYALQLHSVSLGGTFYNNRVLTRQYDANLPGRPTGFQLGNSSTHAADLEQDYVYDTAGRFYSLTSKLQGATTGTTFNYNYLANSDLVSGFGITGSPFQVSRGYEATRSVMNDIKSQWSGSSPVTYAEFDYLSDGARRRSSAQQSGSAFNDYYSGMSSYTSVYTAYTYGGTGTHGELAAAAMYTGAPGGGGAQLPGRAFDYWYDSAGNRTYAGPSTTQTSGANDTYQANQLNQYTQKEQNTETILGNAAAGASVTMGGPTVNKIDRNFAASEVVSANGAATYNSVTVSATLGSNTQSVTRNYLLPPQPQTLGYDADGNLSSDGLWSYTYDGENRLIRMQSLISGLGGTPYELEFSYDYLGRRVEKIVYQTSGSLTFDRRYLYDGNNLIAETDTSGNILRSYAWGLDLAGSLTASGGVGSLLSLTNYSGGAATTYFAGSDGNGNIAVLVNASTGALAAAYEYSPFGELYRSQAFDSTVADNPFRFSSKFSDLESGFVYYGHRYYSAGLGRFINKDPIEEAGGINLYGFVHNDAVNYWDKLGNASYRPVTRIHGSVLVGVQAGASATAGNGVAGVGLQGSVGWGAAFGGNSGFNQGTFAAGGAYIGNPLGGYSAVHAGQSTVTVGATAGYWAGGLISNATNVAQLDGPFKQYNLDLPLLNFSYAKGADGTWTFSITAGPSIGFAYSAYTTTTKTDGRNSPDSSTQLPATYSDDDWGSDTVPGAAAQKPLQMAPQTTNSSTDYDNPSAGSADQAAQQPAITSDAPQQGADPQGSNGSADGSSPSSGDTTPYYAVNSAADGGGGGNAGPDPFDFLE